MRKGTLLNNDSSILNVVEDQNSYNSNTYKTPSVAAANQMISPAPIQKLRLNTINTVNMMPKYSSIVESDSMEVESKYRGMYNSVDGGSMNMENLDSPARNNRFNQSLDQYFLGGLNSDNAHLKTLSKTILRQRTSPHTQDKHMSAMAPTANSLNNAMRVFRNQQKVLQENARKAIETPV